MTIRDASNSDIPAIKTLVFSVLEEYGLQSDPKSTDADLDDLEDCYIRNGGYFGVMESNGAIIGSVGLFRASEVTCELRKMYLQKDERGKGYGRLLLEFALEKAHGLGFRRVTLETASVLKEAIALYKEYGFRESLDS